MSKRIIVNNDFFKIKKTSAKRKPTNKNNLNLKTLRKKILNELNTKSNESNFKNESFVKTNTVHNPKKQLKSPVSKSSPPAVNSLQDAFSESMSFLEKKNKTARVKPAVKTIKNENVSLELPTSLQEIKEVVPTSPIQSTSTSLQHSAKEPAYGCMKRGIKPTYRTLQTTLKNHQPIVNSPPPQPTQPKPVEKSPPPQPKPVVNSPPPQPKPVINSPPPQPKPVVNSPPPQPKPIVNSPPPQPKPLELVITETPETSSILSNFYREQTKQTDNSKSEDLKQERNNVANSTSKEEPILDNNEKNIGEETNNNELYSKALLNNDSYLKQLHNRGKNHRKSKYNRTYKAYTVTEKVIVGKRRDGKVSVIINDNKTRRKNSDIKKSYDRTPLREIRKYLQEINLLEPGSKTPEDVLRTMYSNARMSGNIKNINKQAIIDGYLNNKDEV